MAEDAAALREQFRARIADEELADPRVKALERWALRLPDERLAEGIELITIGLDASRKSRWTVLRTIDDELRDDDPLFPHAERVTFLRWVVRARETDATVQARLHAILHATSAEERQQILHTLTAVEDAPSIEHAHAIFAHAWRAAPPAARPPGAVHRGEPTPVLGARGTVRLAVFLARRVEHLVPWTERKTFGRLLTLARTAASAGRASPSLSEALGRAQQAGAMRVAFLACAEARAALLQPAMAGIAARPSAVRVVELLAAEEGDDAVRALLSDLDEELRRLDVVHALEVKKKVPSRPLVRALHRAEHDGSVVLWLAELEGGALGLLREEGRTWTWAEGRRDDVLAMVPDAHFEGAVQTITV